ncbi:MAG: hypothetical protein HRT45_00035 [Bdellovibrionales bacterium]|nr:hypothetical protein [Bdellovibrionales bacterium]
MLKFKNQNLFDLLPLFKSVQINASMDGIGRIGEFVRDCLDWRVWQKNFDSCVSFAESNENVKVVFDYTCTSYGLVDLHNVFEFVDSLNIEFILKPALVGDRGDLASPFMLPKRVLFSVLQRQRKKIQSIAKSGSASKSRFIGFIEELQQSTTCQELFGREAWLMRMKQQIELFRELHGEQAEQELLNSIFADEPLLQQWWRDPELLTNSGSWGRGWSGLKHGFNRARSVIGLDRRETSTQ